MTNKKEKPMLWIEPKDVQDALTELNPDCEHPYKGLDIRLGTKEYRCAECQKLYWYADVREIVDGKNKKI